MPPLISFRGLSPREWKVTDKQKRTLLGFFPRKISGGHIIMTNVKEEHIRDLFISPCLRRSGMIIDYFHLEEKNGHERTHTFLGAKENIVNTLDYFPLELEGRNEQHKKRLTLFSKYL